MNRQAKRRKKREMDKIEETIEKLTPRQLEVVEHLANVKAKILADNHMNELTTIIDRNLSATLISLGLNFKQIDKIEGIMAKMTEEDSLKYKKITEKYKSEKEFEEFMKKVERDVRREIEIILDKGISKKEAIEELQFKFPALSKSMLINAYQKVKEELEDKKESVEVTDEEIEEAVKYIFEEEEKMKNEGKEIVTKNDNANEVKKNVEEKECKLKIKSMVVEGENGTYKICSEGVELNRDTSVMFFENIEQLEKFMDEYKQAFQMLK